MSAFDAPVAQHMSSPVYSVTEDTSLPIVRDRIRELGVSALAVLRDTSGCELVGVVTRSDLYRAGEYTELRDMSALVLPDDPVTTVMTTDPVRVRATDTAADAARSMIRRQIHRVFVEDESGVIGVFSARDAMRLVAEARITTPLFEIMSSPVIVVRADQTVDDAVQKLDAHKVSGLVVLDQSWPCGLFTHEDALIARRLPLDLAVRSVMNTAMLQLSQHTPLHIAAATAASMDARRVVVMREDQVVGVATGLDFCEPALL